MQLVHDLVAPDDGAGDAQTLVLLHGLSSSRESFHNIIPHLTAAGHRVCNVDLRGHGETGSAPSYRATEYADDVAELIDTKLDGGPVVIVGHSLGGLAASALAMRRRELVSGIFLEDPPLFEGDDDIRSKSPAAMFFPIFVAKIRGWQQASSTVDDIADAIGRGPSPHGGTVEERNGREQLRAQARALLAFDPAAMDAAISGRMWEGYDPLTPVTCSMTVLRADPAVGAVFQADHGERLVEAVPSAQVDMVAGAAHRIHGDRDGEAPFLAALDRLLTKLD